MIPGTRPVFAVFRKAGIRMYSLHIPVQNIYSSWSDIWELKNTANKEVYGGIMKNRLSSQTSPYLLQHAHNPVDWFPWGKEAFEQAAAEDKPVFLSIGYSTCHWCHVMAKESFENEEIATLLNKYFISIKVDREERPDIDSVYMAVCQAYTGSGGWPMSIFMTAQQKPFFAGTYFPPVSRYGMTGFRELLLVLADQWARQRDGLLTAADQLLSALIQKENHTVRAGQMPPDHAMQLPEQAAALFHESFDFVNGGFGPAPKFPLAHNLIFLMLYAEIFHKKQSLQQALLTLRQMRRGGIFDQIGSGFSRYSTDTRFFVPHFEKMLYDNALLIAAYAIAYKISGEFCYLDTALETAGYVLREMTGDGGAFFAAQDADSDGKEGEYYIWSQEEICRILGAETGSRFCRHFGVTKQGNFEGKNILHLLDTETTESHSFEAEKKKLYEYRRQNRTLHTDDKILTSWNALMICALSLLYRVSGQQRFLTAAQRAQDFIDTHLADGLTLYAAYRNGRHTDCGFLDDYAYQTMALLSLYEGSGRAGYLERAQAVCLEAIRQFADDAGGGYFLYGSGQAPLITRPKESYDGALPSGNSAMAYSLVRLSQLTEHPGIKQAAKAQLAFLSEEASHYPAGYSLFLTALLFENCPPPKITVVLSPKDSAGQLLPELPLYADLTFLQQETENYRIVNGKTTYYVCKNYSCLPPSNEI